MGATIAFYFGRALQLMGIVTVAAALFVFNGGDGEMSETMRLSGVGMAEFFAGYGLTMMTGKKG